MAIKSLHENSGHSISALCAVADLNRSSYYKWLNRKPSRHELENRELLHLIGIVYEEYNGIYGYRRITLSIKKKYGKAYNHKRIYRLMRVSQIKSVIRKKKNRYVKVKPQIIAENVLNREFSAYLPNEKWLTDVTEFKYGPGKKAYLSAILDLTDRRIVSYVIGQKNNNHLVFKTFDLAVVSNPNAQPIFHSDRGFQYTNRTFKTKLDKAGMTQSMSRPGRCIDNGPMEGFWGILKAEMYYLHKFKDFDSLVAAIVRYIHFYNHERFQEKLDSMTPFEYHHILLATA